MSALRTFSPLPLLRLLAAPRAMLVLIGGASWTFGIAWIATMVRFNSMEPNPELETGLYGALVGTLLLFGVPALVGIVLGEAAQELFRRPLTSRLPGLNRRVAGAALSIGLVSCLLVFALTQFGWEPLGWRLSAEDPLLPCPLATFSVALLGFSAGSWLLVRVGYGWGWTLRFAGFFALAFVAQPLLLAGTHSVSLALVIVMLSALALAQRFRPALVSKMAQGSVPTIFGGIEGWGKSTNRAMLQKTAKSELLPPRELGRDLSGWCEARDYEQLTARNGVGTKKLFVITGAIPILVLLAGPFVRAVLRGFPDGGPWALLASSLLGASENGFALHADWLRDQMTAGTSLFFLLGLAMSTLAVLASVPLSTALFYPLSRRLYAKLAFRTALVIGIAHASVTAALGLGIGAVLLLLGGGSWPRGIPTIVLVELVLLVLYPLMVLAGLHLRRAFSDGKLFRGVVVSIVPVILVLVLFPTHVLPRVATLFAHQPMLSLLGYAALVTTSFALLRFLFERHYRRADLA